MHSNDAREQEGANGEHTVGSGWNKAQQALFNGLRIVNAAKNSAQLQRAPLKQPFWVSRVEYSAGSICTSVYYTIQTS